MKARLLTKILNDTKYLVNNNRDYIAVGSVMCHQLISVDKNTLKLKYALDTFMEGRAALAKESQSELLFIWDKLQELIDNGQIQDIINGDDKIENPIKVWTFEDGKLIETYTDKIGYPNTTFDGYIMYDNTYFEKKENAIKKAMSEYSAGVSMYLTRVIELERELNEAKDSLKKYEGYVAYFKSIDTQN